MSQISLNIAKIALKQCQSDVVKSTLRLLIDLKKDKLFYRCVYFSFPANLMKEHFTPEQVFLIAEKSGITWAQEDYICN